MRNSSMALAAITGVALIIVLTVTECSRSARPLTPPGSTPTAHSGGGPGDASAPALPPAGAATAPAPDAPDVASPGPGETASDVARPDGQTTPGAAGPAAAPAHPAQLPAGLTSGVIPGGGADLERALAEASPVTYRIVGVGATNGRDRTELLDAILAANGWPTADQLVLVVFTQDGHDLRFAMGSVFRERGIEFSTLLALVRSEYQPRARQGDPAGGLAALIRAVNRQVQ